MRRNGNKVFIGLNADSLNNIVTSTIRHSFRQRAKRAAQGTDVET